MDFELRALPDNAVQRVYKGRFYVKKKILFLINVEEPLINETSVYSTSNMLPLDNAAGGVYDINTFTAIPAGAERFLLQQRFNFVPNFSALDIGGGYQTIVTADLSRVYSPIAPTAYPKNTPFHNFYTNPVTSENHIQFTSDNGRWLLSELKGVAGTYKCENTCASVSTMGLGGPPNVCQSGTSYSVYNLPPNASVTWNLSPNLTQISAQGANPLVVQANGSGNAWIDATVNYACGSQPLNRFNVLAGTPSTPGSIIGPNSLCPNSGGYYRVEPVSGALSYNWVWSGLQYYSGGYNYNITLSTPSNFGGGYVQVSAVNNCGSSTPVYLPVGRYYSCYSYYSYSVSPNPSTDNIRIKSTKEETTPSETGTVPSAKKPKIEAKLYYFADGSLAKTYQVDKEDFGIDTRKLKRGKYVLHIIENGNIVVVEQLIFE